MLSAFRGVVARAQAVRAVSSVSPETPYFTKPDMLAEIKPPQKHSENRDKKTSRKISPEPNPICATYNEDFLKKINREMPL